MISRFTCFIFLLIQSYNSNAQSIMIGAGGTYGTEVKQVGLNARLYYGVNEQICFGPEFSYFPTIQHHDESIQLNEYGFVVHYILEVKERVGVYPLLGINYSVEKSEQLGLTHVQNEFGALLGGGMHLQVKNFMPFIEYKYITGNLSQSTFSLGLIYNLLLKEE